MYNIGMKLARLKKYLPTATILTAIFASIALSVPIERTELRTEPINLATKYTKSSNIELGETKVEKQGQSGEEVVTYSVKTNLFQVLFGINSDQRERLSSKVTKESKQKVVATGTKKYQYMYCSDGSHRYYTDEQFKQPSVGFTSKSEDFCAKNNQGKKLRLADSAPGLQQQPQQPTPSPGCTSAEIPYKTIYKDAPYLDKGETNEYQGFNGWIFDCHNGSKPIRTEPIDKIVYVGTREPLQTDSPAPSSPSSGANAQAAAKCRRDYNNAIAQLRMANAMAGSGMQTVQSIYQRCMSSAGY